MFKLLPVLVLSCFVFPLAKGLSFYCSDADNEGLSYKLDGQMNALCVNAGPARASFCTEAAAQRWKVVAKAEGHVLRSARQFNFIEFVVEDEGKESLAKLTVLMPDNVNPGFPGTRFPSEIFGNIGINRRADLQGGSQGTSFVCEGGLP